MTHNQPSQNNCFTQRYLVAQSAYTDGVLIHRRQAVKAPGLSVKAKKAQAAYKLKIAKRRAKVLSVAELTQKTLAFSRTHGTNFNPEEAYPR